LILVTVINSAVAFWSMAAVKALLAIEGEVAAGRALRKQNIEYAPHGTNTCSMMTKATTPTRIQNTA
jgi:hypothetical protein